LKLKNEFENFYKRNFGDYALVSPIFYGFPISIRYQIGMGLICDGKEEKYVKNAIHRAFAVFNELFNKDDDIYVVVNSYEDNPNDMADDDISVVHPLIHIKDECNFVFTFTVEDALKHLISNSHTRYILKAAVRDVQVEKLLEEIAWSDIDGRNSLRGCVYWINPRNNVIYHFYDDRGLDVASNSKANLEHIYSKFNDWILEYDRKRIDNIFNESSIISCK